MSDRFTDALRQLGHVYMERAEDIAVEERVRHVAKMFLPTDDVKPICGSDGAEHRMLGCPQLYLDSNCEQCRESEGLAPAITKRSLMLHLINTICDIEQIFLDAMYWNFYNPEHEPINPDPDGELAKGWVESQMQIVSMMARFEPTMKRHEGRFGWPSDLDAGDEGEN